ncbi:hypothetical protein RR42_s1002 [Cupriavidus basilensis]|uniref:Uncharacterized protein n=1 Tax=Cupriavidus basilensis TaxID=68895 RepID=A0A0C4YAR0_9BURK|nr:hypothetical protein RR42_s1002 [Cupriavidus basilensis]
MFLAAGAERNLIADLAVCCLLLDLADRTALRLLLDCRFDRSRYLRNINGLVTALTEWIFPATSHDESYGN